MSVLYVSTDILAATALYEGYSYTARQVSELSAIGAPTRPLWIAMSTVWTALVIAYAAGVWLSSCTSRSLRVTAVLLTAWGAIGLAWVVFAPMHTPGTRGMAGDVSHLIVGGVQILVMVLFMAFGSGADGKGFRVFSVVTILAMLASGAVPGTQAQAIAAGQSVPWFGAIERVAVYAPMLWVVVLSLVLFRHLPASTAETPSR